MCASVTNVTQPTVIVDGFPEPIDTILTHTWAFHDSITHMSVPYNVCQLQYVTCRMFVTRPFYVTLATSTKRRRVLISIPCDT